MHLVSFELENKKDLSLLDQFPNGSIEIGDFHKPKGDSVIKSTTRDELFTTICPNNVSLCFTTKSEPSSGVT
ncbi:hypothetical protein BpHYR1_052920 [Brachionus plicatilis]|uniref:Uncharacterized protein n=1 Tax=Brachionus plicatilis TaxID=10195 RepID=A0A3M7S986_BRAPC|nr:hypothetical protein BpHYR1_052920 [Brachionus plicatilis]